MQSRREVWITGIGVLSALGDGHAEAWSRLTADDARPPAIPRGDDHPFVTIPVAEVDLSNQIPKRGDQRQMEPWQRYGVYAAGRALEDAGIKDDAELLDRTDMVVAAGGGERDVEVDDAALELIMARKAIDETLNEHLANNLRPTLFLAQLPNLLAGNIAIVHGVAGSSRTFMGEEIAGADAVSIAFRRVAAGQSDLTLVGGAFNAERPDMWLLFEMAQGMWHGDHAGVWERQAEGGGLLLGSGGAFLVVEAAEHARARGVSGHARLVDVQCDQTRRGPGEAIAAATRQWQAMAPRLGDGPVAVMSGACGMPAPTGDERAFLETVAAKDHDIAIRATGSLTGHLVEAQFPMGVALAALVAKHGKVFPPRDESGVETPDGVVSQAVATGWGHWRGEAMALVETLTEE